MHIVEEQHLGSELTAHCGRQVRVTRIANDAVCVVLEPTGDRGRVELIASGAGHRWTITDRGVVSALYGLDLDFVISKISGFDTALRRRGNEMVATTDDQSLAEFVAEFVDSIEFVPVLAGLFANDRAA